LPVFTVKNSRFVGSFERGVEIQLVGDRRPPEGAAVLVPLEVRNRRPLLVVALLRVEIHAVQILVPEVLEGLAAEQVRPALGDHVDHAADASAVLGGRLADDHLEFLNR
jgi:hypothetical protein